MVYCICTAWYCMLVRSMLLDPNYPLSATVRLYIPGHVTFLLLSQLSSCESNRIHWRHKTTSIFMLVWHYPISLFQVNIFNCFGTYVRCFPRVVICYCTSFRIDFHFFVGSAGETRSTQRAESCKIWCHHKFGGADDGAYQACPNNTSNS